MAEKEEEIDLSQGLDMPEKEEVKEGVTQEEDELEVDIPWFLKCRFPGVKGIGKSYELTLKMGLATSYDQLLKVGAAFFKGRYKRICKLFIILLVIDIISLIEGYYAGVDVVFILISLGLMLVSLVLAFQLSHDPSSMTLVLLFSLVCAIKVILFTVTIVFQATKSPNGGQIFAMIVRGVIDLMYLSFSLASFKFFLKIHSMKKEASYAGSNV